MKYSKNTVAMQLYHQFGNENIYFHLTNNLKFKHIIRQAQRYNGSILTDLAPSPLALGQLSYGATLKELTDAYAAFPRDGVFTSSKGYIAVYDKDNHLLLKNSKEESRINWKEYVTIQVAYFSIGGLNEYRQTIIPTIRRSVVKQNI